MDDATMAMTPEERLSNGLCCECGLPLAGLDVPHHSATHWPEFIRPDGRNAEAIRRQALLKDYTPPAATSGAKGAAEHAPASTLARPTSTPTPPPSAERK